MKSMIDKVFFWTFIVCAIILISLCTYNEITRKIEYYPVHITYIDNTTETVLIAHSINFDGSHSKCHLKQNCLYGPVYIELIRCGVRTYKYLK